MLIALYLLFLGLCLGSFVNALVWRTHEQGMGKKKPSPKSSVQSPNNLSILKGRSMCPNCKHELAVRDLIPLFSWLFLRGRCRYCHKPISTQYPVVEAATAAVFLISYIFWPQALHGGQIVLFAAWLAVSVGLMALLIYDLKWMLLPNSILYPTFFLALAGQLIFLLGYQTNKVHGLIQWGLSLAIAAGVFYLLYYLSKGKWIGFGDVRLGLITGTLLQTPAKSFLMIFMASLLGLIAIVPLIATGRRHLSGKIPYGPFLISATFICLLFGDNLINWYKNLFGL